MPAEPEHVPDDPATAPESGTIRDDTSGNLPAAPQERPVQLELSSCRGIGCSDDIAVAGESR